MKRSEINRSGEMTVFVRVVELGSFSQAARDQRLTPSAVSKLISRLETRLGSRLVNRSTRKLQLTAEGCVFYERAIRILSDIDEAELGAATGELPTGRIRFSSSASYVTHILAPVLPLFLQNYPGILLDIIQTDQLVDLLAERVDVVVRAGALKNSGLITRKLGDTAMVIVASPAYLALHGIPQNAEDLALHQKIIFSYARMAEGWPLRENASTTVLPANGRVQVSDGEAMRKLALDGAGLARMAYFTVSEDISAGRLIPVLEALNPGDREVFHAIHVGNGGHLPARTRAFLDFLAEHGRVS